MLNRPGARILVVDDELSIRNLLELKLKQAGFSVLLAENAAEARQAIHDQRPDGVILDLNLPDLFGTDLCKLIRQDPTIGTVPILVLTGCNIENLPASCLEGGADDFVQKPFKLNELIARLHALLRRPRLYAADDSVIERGRIQISMGERKVLIKGRRIDKLAPKEFELLSQLVLHSPKVLGKSALARKVWGAPLEELNQRTLDVHIRRVRQKLGSSSVCLRTIPAVGFQWLDPASRKSNN